MSVRDAISKQSRKEHSLLDWTAVWMVSYDRWKRTLLISYYKLANLKARFKNPEAPVLVTCKEGR